MPTWPFTAKLLSFLESIRIPSNSGLRLTLKTQTQKYFQPMLKTFSLPLSQLRTPAYLEKTYPVRGTWLFEKRLRVLEFWHTHLSQSLTGNQTGKKFLRISTRRSWVEGGEGGEQKSSVASPRVTHIVLLLPFDNTWASNWHPDIYSTNLKKQQQKWRSRAQENSLKKNVTFTTQVKCEVKGNVKNYLACLADMLATQKKV